jgi:hypothetical protein
MMTGKITWLLPMVMLNLYAKTQNPQGKVPPYNPRILYQLAEHFAYLTWCRATRQINSRRTLNDDI